MLGRQEGARRERLAKLAGGVAVIRVGGSTDVEVKEKKDRFEDAMHVTKAAAEEGIVRGGGMALLRAKVAMGRLSHENDDVQSGIKASRLIKFAAMLVRDRRQLELEREFVIAAVISPPPAPINLRYGIEPCRLFNREDIAALATSP